jgi:putative transposase
MRCVDCDSAAVSERSERTAQGYRRFRCRTCGKQFNERSTGLLNRTQYPSDVIALVESLAPAWLVHVLDIS